VTAAFKLHTYAALRTGRRRAPRPGPVTAWRVAPAAMAKALELARGDPRRLEIRDEFTVIVRNRPRRG